MLLRLVVDLNGVKRVAVANHSAVSEQSWSRSPCLNRLGFAFFPLRPYLDDNLTFGRRC